MNTKHLLIIAVSAMLFHCKGKDGEPGPKGDSGTSSNSVGTTGGRVYVTDEFGNGQNPAGVKVILEGSNPVVSTFCDSAGRFVFQNVPVGTYNLTYVKDNFPTYKLFGFPVLPGPKSLGTQYYTTMSPVSSTTITDLSVRTDSSFSYKTIRVKAKIAQSATPNQPRRVMLVYGNQPNVSVNDVDDYYTQSNYTGARTYGTSVVSGDSAVFTLTYSLSNPSDPLLIKGQKVYFIAYGTTNYSSDNSYYEEDLSKTIYPSLGTPSNRTSLVLP